MLSRLAARSLRPSSSCNWLHPSLQQEVGGILQLQQLQQQPQHAAEIGRQTGVAAKSEVAARPALLTSATTTIDKGAKEGRRGARAKEEVKAEASGDEEEEEESDAEPDPHHGDGLDARTREQYVHKEARKRIAAEGAAPASKTALDSLARHLESRCGPSSSSSSSVSSSSSSLSSSAGRTLAPLSVSLFNLHSTEFAQRLLDRSIGNLVLVESALEHSMRAKEFARGARRRVGHARVHALHADAAALFGLERKGKRTEEEPRPGGRRRTNTKPPAFSFPDQLVARPPPESDEGTAVPLRLRSKDIRPPSSVRAAPIIVCPLGAQTQQAAVLEALLRSLLRHHLAIDEKGLFALGEVELVTFLHSEQAAHLLSARSASLAFLAHSTRRRSQLLHVLFEIGRFGGPLSAASFSPPLLAPGKRMGHAKKLKEAGFGAARWHGCWLRPRATVAIGGREVLPPRKLAEGEEEDDSARSTLPAAALLAYAAWCEALGRVPATRRAADALSVLIPESAPRVRSIIGADSAKIGEVTVEETDAVFLEALPELQQSPATREFAEKHLRKAE